MVSVSFPVSTNWAAFGLMLWNERCVQPGMYSQTSEDEISSITNFLSFANEGRLCSSDSGWRPCSLSKELVTIPRPFKLLPHCKMMTSAMFAPTWEIKSFMSCSDAHSVDQQECCALVDHVWIYCTTPCDLCSNSWGSFTVADSRIASAA